MNCLLDTQIFLWWIMNSDRLSRKVRSIISDPDNTIFISAASAWEIGIKFGLGRLELPDSPERCIPRQIQVNGFEVLPIQLTHVLLVHGLPELHRDPFDRILVCQSVAERLSLVTADALFKKYKVFDLVWNA